MLNQIHNRGTSANQISLILFDLDGVLLDSRTNMEAAWRAVQGEFEVTIDFSAYFAQIGRPFGDIMNSLGLETIADDAEKTYRKASLDSMNLLKWYEGAANVLATAKMSGLKIGVVTSKDHSRTSAALAMLPVEFSTVQTPRPGLRGKPAPDHLLVACAECNVDPSNTMYIGDMAVDCESAKRAGVAYAHAAWGYGSPPHGDCSIIPSLVHLAMCVESGKYP